MEPVCEAVLVRDIPVDGQLFHLAFYEAKTHIHTQVAAATVAIEQ